MEKLQKFQKMIQRLKFFVIPTNEELMIAKETMELLN